MSNENEKTITLHNYNDIAEARMIQAKLQEHGIPSFLNDENVLGMDPVGGMEVKIFEKDKEAAEKVLALS